jgi:hypothetical protein
LPSETLEVFMASLEDIVASKLYSDRDSDGADVRSPEVLARLDWERLAEVAADMSGSMLIERRYKQFLHNYQTYREEFGR